MSARGTAALALLLAVLATYLSLSGPSRATDAADVGTPPLLTIPEAAVTGLELSDAIGRLSFVRTPTGWHDAAERALPSGVVTDLLDALTTLRPITVVDDTPGDVRDYGLGPGATRLRLVGDGGRPVLDLEIGGRNPAWTGLYARRDGEPGVFLVGALLQWELDKLRSTARAQSSP